MSSNWMDTKATPVTRWVVDPAAKLGNRIVDARGKLVATCSTSAFGYAGAKLNAASIVQDHNAQLPASTETFRISADYIEWAHGPGAESEGEGYDTARELVGMLTKKDHILIPASRADLVREIASVAELYVGGRETDLRAARVLKRARAFLAKVSA